jgi:hypothetical protein
MPYSLVDCSYTLGRTCCSEYRGRMLLRKHWYTCTRLHGVTSDSPDTEISQERYALTWRRNPQHRRPRLWDVNSKGKAIALLNQAQPHGDVWRSGGTVRDILNRHTRWRCVYSFTPPLLCPQHPLYKRLGGPQSRSGRCAENHLCSCRVLNPAACSSSYVYCFRFEILTAMAMKRVLYLWV